MSRKRTKKTKSTKASRQLGYNKVRARTERMNLSVRLAFCILVLMGSFAFLATTLQPYNELEDLKKKLARLTEDEEREFDKFEDWQRDLHNLRNHPEYREMRARDILNRSKADVIDEEGEVLAPGEHIFRIER